jgi:hypothetical protein
MINSNMRFRFCEFLEFLFDCFYLFCYFLVSFSPESRIYLE